MFVRFFYLLREARLPVSLREYLTLLEALDKDAHGFTIDGFYYLSRAALVKDERLFDRFDQVFGHYFKGLELEPTDPKAEIPEEWLRRLAERHLSEEEKALIQSMGGFEALMEALRKRLAEQQERHEGGSKWIGVGGTSPFGAYGYNPEGIRIGQHESRHRRAVKVWDKREFRDFDDSVELGTRNMKLALRRLRQIVREGAADQLDLPETIRGTARNAGLLDLAFVPERKNRVKVLLCLDAGGSMDDHVQLVERLFSAARSEFVHLEHYYFHNCPYEGLWKSNARRRTDVIPTWDVIHTYGRDYKLLFVGDASMSPYEIAVRGGAIEYWNDEAGAVWMRRLLEAFPHAAWLNPVPRRQWRYTESIGMMRELMDDRMYPLTLAGIEEAMRGLDGTTGQR